MLTSLQCGVLLTPPKKYGTKEVKRAGDFLVKLDECYRIIYEAKPRLRFCERFDETSELWNFSRHNHPYIELMYFLDGKGKLEVSGTQMSISLFDTVVYPAGWPHQEEATAEKRREIICLWVDIPELELDAPIQLHDRNNAMSLQFLNIYNEAKREQPEPYLLEYGMKQLLTRILRDHSESQIREDFLTCVLQYIHTHFAERIMLDDLAKLEHISKSYLCRQFKQQTGMTVIAYVNNLRIETAKRLLLTTATSVNEIAYRVGFESPKYFYRAFKALVGQSPAAFCRQYKEQ